MNTKIDNVRALGGKRGFSRLLLAGLVVSTLAGGGLAKADEESALRREGLAEVKREFLRKGFEVSASLVESTGPEFLSSLVGKPLEGCPAAPATAPSDTFSLNFRLGGAGSWAGRNDGVNAKMTTGSGLSGSAFAVPSNSSARLPDNRRSPQLEFLMDGTRNVSRSLIDEAVRRLDQCLSKVPAGTYVGDELARLCPYPEVQRGKAGQTCVSSVSGILTDKLPDGSGYKVTVNQSTLCDFTGFGGTGATSTTFNTCYNQRYEGVARVTSGNEGATFIRTAAAQAQRQCKESRKGRRRNAQQINSCVARSMARVMQQSGR